MTNVFYDGNRFVIIKTYLTDFTFLSLYFHRTFLELFYVWDNIELRTHETRKKSMHKKKEEKTKTKQLCTT